MNSCDTGFNDLPQELLVKIFEYCDVRSLCRLAQTCRKINVLVDQNYLWKGRSRFVLGSNLNASPMRKRSKPVLSMKRRYEISKKWKLGAHKKQLILRYPRCMPWLYLEQNSLYCSYGRILLRYSRDENGLIVHDKTKKLIPYIDDISKFVINGDEIIIGGIDGTIGRWNKSSFQKLYTMPSAHEKDVSSIDAKEDIILSGSKDCSIKIWKIGMDNITLKTSIPIGIRVLSLAIMPTNRFFVVGLPGTNNKHPLQLFDVERGQFVTTFGSTYRKGAGILDIYPEFENMFLSCGYDTTVQLWDKRSPLNCAAKWTEPYDNSIYSVKSDHNITIVTGANRHGIIHVWDKRSSKCPIIHYVREFNSPTYCVTFDGSHIFVAFDKGALQFSYL